MNVDEVVSLVYRDRKRAFVLPLDKETVGKDFALSEFQLQLPDKEVVVALSAVKPNREYKVVQLEGPTNEGV